MRQKKLFAVYGIAIVLLFAFGLAAFYFFMVNDYAFKNDEVVFQVNSGNIVEYDVGTKFIFKENGTSYIGAGDNQFLGDSPLYFTENDNKVVLGSDLIYVNGSRAIYRKAKAFSVLDSSNGLTYNDYQLNGGFLFNGRNAYVFLNPMQLYIHGQVFDLGVFSYVELFDNNTFVVYNTNGKQLVSDYLDIEQVKAVGENYSVDLSNDIYYDSTGTNILIYNNISSLEEIK